MGKHIKKKLSGLPPYLLPNIKGWHNLVKQPEQGSKNRYFGKNWFELLQSGELPLYEGSITLKTKDVHSIVLLNLGVDHATPWRTLNRK